METPAVETGVVVKLDRGFPLVRLGDGRELRCEHATSLVKGSDQRAVVGDVVRISLPDGHDKGIIEETLPRRTSFVRKDPTERALPQTLAANFDLVIIAQPIEDINTRRLERELVLAHETGAEVLVVLTKADLMASPAEVEEVRSHIDGFVGNDELLAISDRDEASVQRLAPIIAVISRKPLLCVAMARAGTPPFLARLSICRRVAALSTCLACAAWGFGMPTKALALRFRTLKRLPLHAVFAIAPTPTNRDALSEPPLSRAI